MTSGMPLETCWAFNKFWNNKFYYKVASCWLLLLIHTTMHGYMSIEFEFTFCSSVNLKKCKYQKILHKWNRILKTRAQKSYANKLSYYQNKRRHEFWRFISVRYKKWVECCREKSRAIVGEVEHLAGSQSWSMSGKSKR